VVRLFLERELIVALSHRNTSAKECCTSFEKGTRWFPA
jgi:hypothetical protein